MIFQPICRLYVKRWVAATSQVMSHIGLENLQFCVVSLVNLQIGAFEHLATRCYKDATLRPAVGWTQPTGRHIGEILQRPFSTC